MVDYNTFMLSDPPRIVIDIAGALMAESMSRKEAGKGSVKQIRASQYRPEPNPVVRVVLDLASTLPYQVVGRPETFRILIGEAVAKVDQVQAPEIARGPLRVRGVEIQEATATSAIIRIQADQPVASHKTFLLDNPPRLVIDISGALMAESMSRKEAGKGPIKQIRASQYRREPDPVVRVVLDLTSTLPYQVTGIPETFRILVGEAVSKARKVPPPVPPTVTAEQPKFAQEEVTKAPEAEEPWGRNVGVWGLGEYESLNRDVTTFEDGYDSDIWRLTTGVDYQFTEQIVAGLAFDYYNHNGDFDNGGDFNTLMASSPLARSGPSNRPSCKLRPAMPARPTTAIASPNMRSLMVLPVPSFSLGLAMRIVTSMRTRRVLVPSWAMTSQSAPPQSALVLVSIFSILTSRPTAKKAVRDWSSRSTTMTRLGSRLAWARKRRWL